MSGVTVSPCSVSARADCGGVLYKGDAGGGGELILSARLYGEKSACAVYLLLSSLAMHGNAPMHHKSTADRSPLVILGHQQLDVGDGLAWIQTLGTGTCTVHDGVAAVDGEGALQVITALSREVVLEY